MSRTNLSSKLVAEKIILSIKILILLVCWPTMPFIPVIFFLMFLVFIIHSAYTLYLMRYGLSYDHNYLYVVGKSDRSIDLSNITQINLTPYFGSFRKMWKIRFIAEDKEQELLFYPRFGVVSINNFARLVALKNPKVSVRYWTFTMDVDL